jgi:hypothetical protein
MHPTRWSHDPRRPRLLDGGEIFATAGAVRIPLGRRRPLLRRPDGDFYDVAMYFIREGRGTKPATVIAGSSRYYAIPIDRLVSLLEENSFIEIQRLDGVPHRPVLVARRGTG